MASNSTLRTKRKTTLRGPCGKPSLYLVRRVINTCTIHRLEIEQKIKGSIEEHVRTAVREWGVLEDTKKFVDSLKSLTQQNDVLCQQAQINFNNSYVPHLSRDGRSDLTNYRRSRHHNSTLDEHADFETVLSKIALPDGSVSKVFPQTLKALFSYDGQSVFPPNRGPTD